MRDAADDKAAARNELLPYWLWLSAQREIDVSVKAELIRAFGTAEKVYRASEEELRSVPHVTQKIARCLQDKSLAEAERIEKDCSIHGVQILTMDMPEYPCRLQEIYSPPVVLYIKGKLPDVDERVLVSVIGTRRASEYGIRMGKEIAYEITRCGGIVVSVMTEGVDSAAAQGALAGGTCIGVLGTAFDHAGGELPRRIAQYGTLITEIAPGTPTQRNFFRERNRIAAGLSLGVVVVEAPEKSGTRLFVADALEQGKDVFALPGNADSETSAGTLKLIRDGASMVTHGWEVMEEYQSLFPECVHAEVRESLPIALQQESAEKQPQKDGRSFTSGLHRKEKKAEIPERQRGGDGEKPAPQRSEASATDEAVKAAEAKRAAEAAQDPALSEVQRSIIGAVAKGCHVPDEIIAETGLTAAQVLPQLTLLQIRGYLIKNPEKGFLLKIIV